MSEPIDIPTLDPELAAYVACHRTSGAPSAEAVARVRARLLARTAAPAVPLRRLPLASAGLAVAALVVALLAGRALVGAAKPDDVAKRQAEKQAVLQAYRAGDLDSALRLARERCSEADCRRLELELSTASRLSKRLDRLSHEELETLARVDMGLTGGADSVLAKKIAERRRALDAAAAPPEGDLVAASAPTLFRLAQERHRERRYEDALSLLQACLRTAPAFHPCQRQLGDVWAAIGVRDHSAAAMAKAHRAYERFLEIAPRDDEYVAKVQAILAAAPKASPVRGVAPEEVRHRARDLYLRGYQLKDTLPDEAARLFREVASMLPADDELAQKARRRLEELERR